MEESNNKKAGVEVQVIDWRNGTPQEVAISFLEFDQMLTLSAASARDLAFRIMQCADFIEPPFQDADDQKD